MEEVKTGRGYVYRIQYHIVWCVKYRRKVLTSEIEHYLFQVLKEIAADVVHSIIFPIGSKDQRIKGLKGVSVFKRYPGIKSKLWGGHLWNPSYFVAAVSENTEEQIREYIQKQKIK